jgi:hypothetical protein
VKRKLFFFGVLVLLIYNFIGCTKKSSDSPTDTTPVVKADTIPVPKPSIYKDDDSTTGIFNYTGIVYDTLEVYDSTIKVSAGHPQIRLQTGMHNISGQINIKKLKSSSTQVYLNRPSIDNYDKPSKYSGLLFQTDPNKMIDYGFPLIPEYDTIIKASTLNNVLNIPNTAHELFDFVYGFHGGAAASFIKFKNGIGVFDNGHWEINYETNGIYGTCPNNETVGITTYYFISGIHSYHLTCIKQ